ncbi:hypothetical protein I317_02922 [Kwoniella heveanensis CBS 569]|nr:hypothetical protein I317_02922 [Kwoniella heveanensis CBS 569]
MADIANPSMPPSLPPHSNRTVEIPHLLVKDPHFASMAAIAPYIDDARLPSPTPENVLLAVRSYIAHRGQYLPLPAAPYVRAASEIEISILTARQNASDPNRDILLRMEESLSEIKTSIRGLQVQINDVKDDVKNVKDDVKSLKDDVKTVKEQKLNQYLTKGHHLWVPVPSSLDGNVVPDGVDEHLGGSRPVYQLEDKTVKKWLKLYGLPETGDAEDRKQVLSDFLSGLFL